MSRPDSSRFPVTVTRLPLTRCEICGRTLAYQPGQASAVLTKHYLRMHPEALSQAAEVHEPRRRQAATRAAPGYRPAGPASTLRVPAPLRM